MKKVFIFFCISITFTCSHKQVKEQLPIIECEDQQTLLIVEKDYSVNMIEVYNLLVRSIKKRDIDSVLSCYTNNSTYFYGDSPFDELSCFNKQNMISGIDNVALQYNHFFKKRYLDSIEYEIIKVNNLEKQLKIINLWANSDYGVYEYLDFEIIEERAYIKKHSIIRESRGAKG